MHMGRLPLDYTRCADGEPCPYKDICARWLTHRFDISPPERYSQANFFAQTTRNVDGDVECKHRIIAT